jgi:hypothetical protein
VGSRWAAGGQQVGSRWAAGGQQAGSRRAAGGQQVGSRRAAGGQQVGSRWAAGGQQVGSRWAAGGQPSGQQVGPQQVGSRWGSEGPSAPSPAWRQLVRGHAVLSSQHLAEQRVRDEGRGESLRCALWRQQPRCPSAWSQRRVPLQIAVNQEKPPPGRGHKLLEGRSFRARGDMFPTWWVASRLGCYQHTACQYSSVSSCMLIGSG